MSISVEVKAIGDATAVILPADVLARLGVKAGDRVQWSETPDGWTLRRPISEADRQMAIAERIMAENFDVLRRLAE